MAGKLLSFWNDFFFRGYVGFRVGFWAKIVCKTCMKECKKDGFLYKGQVHQSNFGGQNVLFYALQRNIEFQDPINCFILCEEIKLVYPTSGHLHLLLTPKRWFGSVWYGIFQKRTLTLRIDLCLKGIAFCLLCETFNIPIPRCSWLEMHVGLRLLQQDVLNGYLWLMWHQ